MTEVWATLVANTTWVGQIRYKKKYCCHASYWDNFLAKHHFSIDFYRIIPGKCLHTAKSLPLRKGYWVLILICHTFLWFWLTLAPVESNQWLQLFVQGFESRAPWNVGWGSSQAMIQYTLQCGLNEPRRTRCCYIFSITATPGHHFGSKLGTGYISAVSIKFTPLLRK